MRTESNLPESSGSRPRVLAIVPAHDEEESIVATMKDLADNAPFVDVLIVNDGSTDATERICQSNGWNHICLPINLGLSGGFQVGVKYAVQNGYDYVVQFDADGQHCAEYIQALLCVAEREFADVVVGSRFLNEKKPLSARMLGSNMIAFLLKLTTGARIEDPTSGMRLYSKRVMGKLASNYDYGPEPDTLALLIRQGCKVVESQVSMRDRQAGESYLSLHRSAVYMMRMVVSILLVQWVRR